MFCPQHFKNALCKKNNINENNLPMWLWAGYFCHSLYILLAVHLIGNMPSELRGMKDNNRKEPWLLSYPYVRNDLSRNANRLSCCGYHPSWNSSHRELWMDRSHHRSPQWGRHSHQEAVRQYIQCHRKWKWFRRGDRWFSWWISSIRGTKNSF